MNNILKAIWAGLVDFRTSVKRNWKLVAALTFLCILAYSILPIISYIIVFLLVWLFKTFPACDAFLSAHPLAIISGVFGLVFLTVVLKSLYDRGKAII